ncbi:hypothetical protein [uncultured Bacteroides sp.]|uniref:hypothetical protein n=1 Tax=uncultured Bacteroides sp. TaxID=162156 RepID=UPI00262A0F66|nr:hypothetical protein [uncultured Bacteroides sp.]
MEKRKTKNKKREGEKGKEKEKGNKGKEKERKKERKKERNGKCGRYIKKRGGMNNFPKKNVSFVVLTF